MEFNAGTRPFTSLYAPCVRVCARRAEVVCGSLVATLPLVTLLLVECLHAPRACFLWICVLCVLCVTVWCSVWQCVSVCCSVLHCRHVSTCDCIVGRMTACMSMSTCPTNTQTQALYIERENKSFIWDIEQSIWDVTKSYETWLIHVRYVCPTNTQTQALHTEAVLQPYKGKRVFPASEFVRVQQLYPLHILKKALGKRALRILKKTLWKEPYICSKKMNFKTRTLHHEADIDTATCCNTRNKLQHYNTLHHTGTHRHKGSVFVAHEPASRGWCP